MAARRASRSTHATKPRVRYAVVGIGWIAQAAVLPAFAHARRNSRLAALVSGDAKKQAALGRRYGVPVLGYEDYDGLLASGEVDAVYIALPNHLHCDFAVRAARARVHVLCEKPLATTVEECRAMIEAARSQRVLLMTAYRLHFEAANLRLAQLVRGRRIGEARIFHSVFANPTRLPDIRLERETGGGTLNDIGIYCVNAARSLFRAEPLEALAFEARSRERRFREVDEMTAGILRFPGDRLASFTSSFAAADAESLQVHGTRGQATLEHAYGFQGKKTLRLTVDGKSREWSYAERDQFAPLLLHLSDCVLRGTKLGPSGDEGLADVRVLEALAESARRGEAVRIADRTKGRPPSPGRAVRLPPARPAPLVRAAPPGGAADR